VIAKVVFKFPLKVVKVVKVVKEKTPRESGCPLAPEKHLVGILRSSEVFIPQIPKVVNPSKPEYTGSETP
jgi:hypothetical protein